MKMHLIPLLLLLACIVLADGWLYFRWQRKTKNTLLRILFWLPSILFIVFFILLRTKSEEIASYQQAANILWIFWLFALLYPPKIVYAVFDSISLLCHKLFGLKPKIISRIGSVIAVGMVVLLIYGAFVGRKKVYVKQVNIEVANLPEAFNGIRIAQFSDLHLGNWGKNTATIARTVELINEQQPDIIAFTGDMVNNFSDELNNYVPILKQLQAPLGKFAILGNHDYGDYTEWDSPEARNANLERTKQTIRNCGFDLLLNEHRTLTVDSQQIIIAGVENWGKPPFPTYGNLHNALEGTDSTSVKILLSHDSSHWRAEVIGHPDIVLTLSGHTHAAQLGLITKHIHISPSAWIYKEWDGLYTENGQYLYVNRGIGYVGIPIRIGAAPEITLIKLVRQK